MDRATQMRHARQVPRKLSGHPAPARRHHPAQHIRGALASLIAAALVLISTQAVAAAFIPDSPRRLTSSERGAAFPRGLVRDGPDSAVAVFTDVGRGGRRIFARRTSDGGVTWHPRIRVSGHGRASHAAVGGDDQGITVAWAEGRDCRRGPCRLWVASSLDGGESFTDPRPLTRSGVPGMVQVARTGQLVMIAWTDWTTGRIRMRVSRDGATTFARPVAIGTTTNTPFGGGLLDGLVAIAIGSGVSHVAYFDTAHRLHVRRSLDEGATWGRSRRIGDASVQGALGLSLAAGNDDAVLAYVDRSRGYRVATQVSVDAGAYWRRATIVSPWGVRWSGWPVVERRDAGSYLVAYELCADARCSKLEMRVAGTSNSGQSWPDRYVAGSRPARLMLPTGLAWTGRVIVSYVLGTRGGRVTDVWAEAADDSTPTSRPARHGSRR